MGESQDWRKFLDEEGKELSIPDSQRGDNSHRQPNHVDIDVGKLTGQIRASVTMNPGAVITFRNSSGDEGRLVLQDDGATRFEGKPEAFTGPFMAMFGDYFEEYINKRVAEALNRISY